MSFELQAGESGCGIYIKTDINGAYLATHYKAYLSERPEDGSLDALFDDADGDTDFSLYAIKDRFAKQNGINSKRKQCS